MNMVMSSIFFFIVAIGVLVTVHEFGHFVVARRLGVKVLRFSVGFGKPLWRRQAAAGETEYVISAIPLGGYVKMLDEREGPVETADLPRAFNRQPVASRMAIVTAGPLFNFLFAIAAYWAVFIIGVPGIKPVIGEVEVNSAAALGGFQVRDQIQRVAGKETPTWDTVIVALLDNALAHKTVVVDVVDAGNRVVDRHLDLGRVQIDLEHGDLLDTIGIRPFRPTLPPVIGKLLADGAANAAGFEVGDRILEANGGPVTDWESWVKIVRANAEKTIHVVAERQGRRVVLDVVPRRVETAEGEIGRIGAAVEIPPDLGKDLRAVERYSPLAAVGAGLTKTWDMSALTLRMMVKMVTGEVPLSTMGGPIRIAEYAGYSANAGWVPFLAFLAVISISLGVLNLLPVPVLDGGHLLFCLIELVKGSPVSQQVEIIGQRVGLALLLSLMLVVFYNDLQRLLN